VDFSQVGAFLSVAPTLEEKAASVGKVARSRDGAGHTLMRRSSEKVTASGEQTPRRAEKRQFVKRRRLERENGKVVGHDENLPIPESQTRPLGSKVAS